MTVSLLFGDCRELLPSLSSQSVESIITDPPYGTTDGKTKLQGIYAGNVWPEFGHEWDAIAPMDWLPFAYPALKDGGSVVVFTDNQKITTLWDEMEKVGLHPLRCLYWHKTNPPTNPRKNFCSSVEVAVFARKPGKLIHWGGGGTTHNFFQCPKVYWGHKIHKTQKPVPLMQWLVKLTTPIGGTILDPFAGGGTTGVAAGEEGMNFVGMENDQEAYDKAKVRLGVA